MASTESPDEPVVLVVTPAPAPPPAVVVGEAAWLPEPQATSTRPAPAPARSFERAPSLEAEGFQGTGPEGGEVEREAAVVEVVVLVVVVHRTRVHRRSGDRCSIGWEVAGAMPGRPSGSKR